MTGANTIARGNEHAHRQTHGSDAGAHSHVADELRHAFASNDEPNVSVSRSRAREREREADGKLTAHRGSV